MSELKRAVDISGKRFGDLTAVRRVDVRYATTRHASWLCVCGKCGGECIVQGRFLRNGTVTSCGSCAAKEKKERDKMYARDMWKTCASLERLEYSAGDPYQNLANAIVAVAADDYRSALKDGNRAIQSKLEEFFISPWCGILTKLDGSTLCEALRKECGAEPKETCA